MVDSIQNNSINELVSGQLQPNQIIERANREASGADNANVVSLSDYAEISDAARNRLASEKDLMKFTSLASRIPADFDEEKVRYFKDMLNSGRINDYLRSFSNDELTDDLLSSPSAAAFLQ